MPKLEPMQTGAMRGGGRRGRRARVSSSLAEINVVPLVDVMLVLLVIFMVATPMMTQGYPVNLPESRRAPAISAPVIVSVPLSFRKDRLVMIGKDPVQVDFLPIRIKQALEGMSQQTVILAADGGITVQEWTSVADRLREGGVTQVSIQSQPSRGPR